MTRAKAQKPPITKISKHEIQNSKQFEMTKILKFQTNLSRIPCFGFSRFEAYLSVSSFRISIFGFWICITGVLARYIFLKCFCSTFKT
jgi:hypothetical protein